MGWIAANWKPIVAIAGLVLGVINFVRLYLANQRADKRAKDQDRRWLADQLIEQYVVLDEITHCDEWEEIFVLAPGNRRVRRELPKAE